MSPENSQPRAKLILLVTTVTAFMTAFMGSSLNIALPIIGKEFNASAVMLSWLSTIYLLTTAALLIPVGKLSDINGRIKFFKLGIVLFSIGSFLCGLAPSTTALLLLRIIQGAGSSLIFSCSTAILVSSFPPSERGKALGINTAAVYTGLSSGPFLGGLITHYWNWRAIFILNSLIGVIIIVLTFFYLKNEWEELVKQKFDKIGATVYVLSIVSLMIGVSLFPKIIGFAVLIIGIFLLITFYFFEANKSNPVFNVTVFRHNRTFFLSNLAALINYSATFAIGFLMSFYLQSVKGLSVQDAGIILITQPVVQALFSPLAGRLSDKHEPQLVASLGMGFLSAGLIVFCFLSAAMSLIIIVANLAFLGLGFALFSSPNVNAVMSSVNKNYYGVASSTLASMRMIGQMFSMGIVIVIFTLFIGTARITHENQVDFMLSARTAFILFSILSIFGIFASLSRGKIHSKIK
jgi:EmrB/QacA subfamily drug resistance transporter